MYFRSSSNALFTDSRLFLLIPYFAAGETLITIPGSIKSGLRIALEGVLRDIKLQKDGRLLLLGTDNTGGNSQSVLLRAIDEGTSVLKPELSSKQPLVYPNPFEEDITITLDSKVTSVSMFDTMGKMISYKVMNDWNPKLTLPVRKGIYLLSVKAENGEQYRKIIIKK